MRYIGFVPKSPEKKGYENITVKEFINISLWSIKLLAKVDKKATIVRVISILLLSVQSIANIYLVAKIFDVLISIVQQENAQLSSMYPYLAVLFLYNVAITIIRFFSRYTESSLRIRLRPRIQKIFYEKLHTLGIQTLENPEINNRINRTEQEIYGIMEYAFQSIQLISVIFSFLVNISITFKFAPILIPIIMVASLPSMLVDRKWRKYVWKFSYENTENQRRAGKHARDLRDTVYLQELFINKAIRYLDKKYTDFYNWYTKEQIKIRLKWLSGMFGLSTLTDLGIYIGYLMIFAKAIKRVISIGDVYFQTQIIQKLSGDFDSLLSLTTHLFEYSIRMKEPYLLFTMEKETIDGNVKLEKFNKGPRIEFKNISFSYPDTTKKVINKLDITIKSGEKVALVGENGAGKTTLMKILSKIYQPTEGEIIVNDIKLNDIKLDTWYENMGVLFQDYNTYPQLTVKENIIMGNPNIKFNSKRMIEAAQNSDALKFIQEFPKKFDQVLSEKYEDGIRPSTGQWQKIAIARFFYRDAPLVIFDEPTAAIDAISEYNIFNKIYKFFKNKTVIIISHRFSTVRNADRILVLDKGKIVEDGTHKELMKLNGLYAKSFNLQAEGYTS